MTLGFTTSIAGEPTFFVEKIWEGLFRTVYNDDVEHAKTVKIYWEYTRQHMDKFQVAWDGRWEPNRQKHKAKYHSIRADNSDRWKTGMNIHMVINNRSANRFQFAPSIKCISVQKIEIKSGKNEHGANYFLVFVDERQLDSEEIKTLAINDGFEGWFDFFEYFNKDFTGKIIHWTSLKY